MVRPIYSKKILENKYYYLYAGDSTDTKPTDSKMAQGSQFHEVDTATIYAYSEAGQTWYKQIELGGE